MIKEFSYTIYMHLTFGFPKSNIKKKKITFIQLTLTIFIAQYQSNLCKYIFYKILMKIGFDINMINVNFAMSLYYFEMQ